MCPYQSQIDAYHDRELPADVSRRFEAHLPHCTGCSEDLQAIDSIARLLQEAPIRPMSQIGMTRIHAAADAAARHREVFPLARGLIAAAASVLVIAGAWLVELPRQPSRPQIGTTRQVENWEPMAMGDRSAYMPRSIQRETGFAQNITNWMIRGLENR